MKIVFCDIDGVLNSIIGSKENGIVSIEPDKLVLLKQLLDETGAELVITSKARFIKQIHEDRLNVIKEYGIKIRDSFDGVLTNRSKAIECLGYLQNKCDDLDNVLILDDNDDDFRDFFKHNFIKVNPVTGLTQKDVDEGISILGELNN